MKGSTTLQRFGVLGATVALIALVAALTPAAQAKGSYKSCADKKIHFKIEDGEGGQSPYTTTVKTISVKGTSCHGAYQYLGDLYGGKSPDKKGRIDGYNCKIGTFKAPLGYVPTICSKGGKTIKYAGQGG
jgi:hypothetical protein